MPPGGDDELVLRASVQDEATAPLERIDRKLDDVGDSAAAAGRKAGGAGAAGLSRMEMAGQKLHNGLVKLDSRLVTMSRTVGGVFATGLRRGAVALGVVTGAVAVFGVKAASNFQATGIAFETMLGSVERGQAMFKELQGLNLRTPFELKDLAGAEQMLLRFSLSGEKSLGVLKGITDIAALSGPEATENLAAMARVIGQIHQTGRLTGQDALQLVSAGIDAYGIYAEKLGITTAEARKLGEAGKLEADVLLDAVTNLEGGLSKFAGGAEKMSRTLLGQWSNLKDAINVGLADAASPMVDALSSQIGTPDKPGPLVGGIMTLIEGAGPPLFSFLGTLVGGVSRLLPVVEPILTAIATGLDRLFKAGGPAMSILDPLGGEIADSLVDLVDALIPVMPDLVELFAALVMILPDFVRMLTALVPIVKPMANLATALLHFAPVRGIMAGLLGVLLGYRALRGIVATLYAFAGGISAINAAEGGSGVAGAAGAAGKGGAARGLGRLLGRAAPFAATAAGGVARGALAVAPYAGTAVAVYGASLADQQARNRANPTMQVDPSSPTGATQTLEAQHEDWLRTHGDLPRRHARTMHLDRLVDRLTPGQRTMSSSYRSHDVLPGSGHTAGTAVDRHGSFMERYRQNVRAAGGWAAQHRGHVHADYGDLPRPTRTADDMPSASSGGGSRTLVVHGNIIGVDDLRGMWERWNRDLDTADRHRHRKVQR